MVAAPVPGAIMAGHGPAAVLDAGVQRGAGRLMIVTYTLLDSLAPPRTSRAIAMIVDRVASRNDRARGSWRTPASWLSTALVT